MIVPCFAAPYEVLMGIVITVAGIPVYCFGVMWKDKPKFIQDTIGMDFKQMLFFFSQIWCFSSQFFFIFKFDSASVTLACQKFLVSAKEEKCD